MGPYQTYMTFRVAPEVGLSSVAASLFSTVMVWATAGYFAFQTGYWVGTQVAGVIETYAPALWDAIGGTISNMIDNVIGAFSKGPSSSGPAEQSTATSFQVGSDALLLYGQTGGVYGEVSDWQEWQGSNNSSDKLRFKDSQ
jgi:hypothetical protein